MNTQLLSFVYSALFVTGLSVGVPMILTGSPWQGATAIILGLIGLQDAAAWDKAKAIDLSSSTLRRIDVVGVFFGAVAVTAPSAAMAAPTRAFWAVLLGSTGYIGACFVFWLLFERLDSTAFRTVLSAWSKRPADAPRFVIAFSVALAVLVTFIALCWFGALDPTTSFAWIAVDIALVAYLALYRVLGAKGARA